MSNSISASTSATMNSNATVISNSCLSTKLMYTQARALIEYVQLYLSQCSELGLAEHFDKYLAKLENEDGMFQSFIISFT